MCVIGNFLPGVSDCILSKEKKLFTVSCFFFSTIFLLLRNEMLELNYSLIFIFPPTIRLGFPHRSPIVWRWVCLATGTIKIWFDIIIFYSFSFLSIRLRPLYNPREILPPNIRCRQEKATHTTGAICRALGGGTEVGAHRFLAVDLRVNDRCLVCHSWGWENECRGMKEKKNRSLR